jgi:hypothetical protein
MFGKDKNRDNEGPAPRDIIRAAQEAEDRQGMPHSAPQAKRPGETPPKSYIETTIASLEKTHTAFVEEGAKLDADIAKLTEERRQIHVAIEATQAAMNILRNQTAPAPGMAQQPRKPASPPPASSIDDMATKELEEALRGFGNGTH